MAVQTKNNFSAFGIRVKVRLIEMGKNQVWLANEIGISKQYLYKLLTDERRESRYKDAISKILGGISV